MVVNIPHVEGFKLIVSILSALLCVQGLCREQILRSLGASQCHTFSFQQPFQEGRSQHRCQNLLEKHESPAVFMHAFPNFFTFDSIQQMCDKDRYARNSYGTTNMNKKSDSLKDKHTKKKELC